jgi:hypothetical protein
VRAVPAPVRLEQPGRAVRAQSYVIHEGHQVLRFSLVSSHGRPAARHCVSARSRIPREVHEGSGRYRKPGSPDP